MLDVFNNKSKAYAAIEHVFDKHLAIVNGTPILKDGVKDFKLKLRAIEAYQVPAVYETVPGTKFKLNLIAAMQVNIEVERNAIILYAQDEKLPVLEGKMPRLGSMLYDGTAEERLRRFQAIHTEAKTLGELLLNYGCGADILTELDNQLPLLRSALSTTQDAIDDRIESQEGFREVFLNMDKFIKNRLDRAVKTRTKEFPDFVEVYLKAKVMPKSPVRKKRETPAKTTTKSAKQQPTNNGQPTDTKDAKQPTTPTTEEAVVTTFRDVPTPPPSEQPQQVADEPMGAENGKE